MPTPQTNLSRTKVAPKSCEGAQSVRWIFNRSQQWGVLLGVTPQDHHEDRLAQLPKTILYGCNTRGAPRSSAGRICYPTQSQAGYVPNCQLSSQETSGYIPKSYQSTGPAPGRDKGKSLLHRSRSLDGLPSSPWFVGNGSWNMRLIGKAAKQKET